MGQACTNGSHELGVRSRDCRRSNGGGTRNGRWANLGQAQSSGHYWWPLARHLRRRGVPVAVVNPLESKYFAKESAAALEVRSGRCAHMAVLGMINQPPTREPWLAPRSRGWRGSACAWSVTRRTYVSAFFGSSTSAFPNLKRPSRTQRATPRWRCCARRLLCAGRCVGGSARWPMPFGLGRSKGLTRPYGI